MNVAGCKQSLPCHGLMPDMFVSKQDYFAAHLLPLKECQRNFARGNETKHSKPCYEHDEDWIEWAFLSQLLAAHLLLRANQAASRSLA